MADKWPLAAGNWSTAANWNGGTLPVDGDDIYLDNRAITLDMDINLPTARLLSTQRTGGTAGGILSVNSTRTMTIGAIIAGSADTLRIGSFVGSFTLTGATATGSATTSGQYPIAPQGGGTNITFTNCTFVGGTGSTTRHGLYFGFSQSGTITFNNCTAKGGGASGGNGVHATTALALTVTGTLHLINDATTLAAAISVSSGTWTLSGDVTHGGSATTAAIAGNAIFNYTCSSQSIAATWPAATSAGLWNYSSTSTTVSTIDSSVSSITLNSSGASGALCRVSSNSGGKMTYLGDITLSTQSFHAFQCSTTSAAVLKHVGTLTGPAGTTTYAGVIVDALSTTFSGSGEFVLDRIAPGSTGVMPSLQYPLYRFETTAQLTVQNEAGTNHVIAATAALLDMPAPANVRSGTSYNLGTQTGTCAVPPAASVAFGVPVDNTTGTAILSGGTDWTANEKTAIRSILGIPASGTAPDDPTVGILDTIRDNVGTKPTLSQIEASTVLAKEATVGTRASQTSVDGKPTLSQMEASTVLAKEATVNAVGIVAAARPTLSAIEASTVLAKEATVNDVQSRLPASLHPGGRMRSHVEILDGDAIQSISDVVVPDMMVAGGFPTDTDTQLGEIYAKADQTNTAVGNVPAAILASVIEGTITLQQAHRLILALIAGDATGMNSNAVFKSIDGTKNRIVATISGENRTVSSRDVS